VALLHERRNDCLLQRRGLAVVSGSAPMKTRRKVRGTSRIADAQARKQRLVGRADVDHLLGIIEPLQRQQRRTRIAKPLV
jgi:hypothetical protein